MTQRVYLNDGWGFTETWDDQIPTTGYDGSQLTPVRLPHTCKETPFHYFDEQIYQMVSGYRRVLPAPAEWEGKTVLLTIEGAAHDSEVFLNGEPVGAHRCGYTAFTLDLSDKLRYGADNILAVRLDSRESLNVPPFGFVIDYMTYGGLYRDVYLDVKERHYLADVFVHTEVMGGSTDRAVLVSEVTLNEEAEGLRLVQALRAKGKPGEQRLGEIPVSGENAQSRWPLKGVRLWDTQAPNLYELKTELWRDNVLLDEQLVTFGFRSAEFRTDGFYLNGKKLRIRGLNRHQSYPYVGYAMPASMQRLDADILKNELGVNAVRTSHYPQSQHFLDRCDEAGLLVFTEIPGWQHIGDDAWKEQALQNVRDMVTQYRNHPSIILWGVRINESADNDELYRRTNANAHALDPSRPTGGVRNLKRSHLLEDVYTYNDFVHSGKNRGCEKKADITSDRSKPYLITEYNGHMYPTKAFDWEEHRLQHALRHANVLDAVAGEDDIAGSFGWCMFDYNTHKDFGSGDRVCYHGVLDMFRNPKPAAGVYASQQDETPVLSVTSSMDIGEHPASVRGDIYILTNADSVRMYKNGRFIKEYTREDSPYQHLAHGPILVDDFIGGAVEQSGDFSPARARDIKSVLNAAARYGVSNLPKSTRLTAAKAMALCHITPSQAADLYTHYIEDWGGTATSYRFDAVKDGQVVKTVVKEPMTRLSLCAQADHTDLREVHSYDVALIRLKAVDENGNQLCFCNEPVVLETEGPIQLIGPAVISLQGGMGGTYIRTTGQPGPARVTIRTAQAEPITLRFTVTIF